MNQWEDLLYKSLVSLFYDSLSRSAFDDMSNKNHLEIFNNKLSEDELKKMDLIFSELDQKWKKDWSKDIIRLDVKKFFFNDEIKKLPSLKEYLEKNIYNA